MTPEDLKNVKIDENLVVLDLEAESDDEAIKKLATHLYQKGAVKESYIQAVRDREKVFSTGLPAPVYGVAIPHTDIEHVNEDAVCIARLKNPVKFKMMGTTDVDIDVKMMFMLALKTPHGQLAFLSSLMEIFQDEEAIVSIVEAKDEKEIVERFKALLIK